MAGSLVSVRKMDGLELPCMPGHFHRGTIIRRGVWLGCGGSQEKTSPLSHRPSKGNVGLATVRSIRESEFIILRFQIKYKAGMTIRVRTVELTIPPIIGAAIRFMTSAPVSVVHIMGSNPPMIAATVIQEFLYPYLAGHSPRQELMSTDCVLPL